MRGRTSTSSARTTSEEAARDATRAAIMDQVAAGLDVITDGEQTRFDFNLSFYGLPRRASSSRVGAAAALGAAGARPARQAQARRRADRAARARRGGGVRAAARAGAARPALKASVPGPYTLAAGRIERSRPLRGHRDAAADRRARARGAGRGRLRARSRWTSRRCSCYAYREDPERFVDIFNRTVEPVVGDAATSARTCASATSRAGPSGRGATRRCSPRSSTCTPTSCTSRWPSREFAELEVIERDRRSGKDVGVGVDRRQALLRRVARRRRGARARVPAATRRPSGSACRPTAGCSQTARWAARRKLQSLVAGARRAR